MFRSLQELRMATDKVKNSIAYLDRFGTKVALVHGLLGEASARLLCFDQDTYEVQHGPYQLDVDIHSGIVSLVVDGVTISSKESRGRGIPPKDITHAHLGLIRIRLDGFGSDLRTCKVTRTA